MTKSKWGAAVLLTVTLLVGALLGGVAASATDWRRPDHGRACHSTSGFVDRLTKELDLSSSQRDSVRGIFNRYEPAMDSIWKDLHPRFDSIKKLVRAEIRIQLTVEQQKKFAELSVRMDSLRSIRSRGMRGENAR